MTHSKVVTLIIIMLFSLAACSNRKQWSEKEIKDISANIDYGVVVVYTTPSCTYCHQTKDWLKKYDFPFTECDIENENKCRTEFQKEDGHGVPMLIVRYTREKHVLKNGFDPNEFLEILQ